MEETCFAPGMIPQNRVDSLDDDTLVYVNRNNIVVLKKARLPQIIHSAHSKIISGIAAAPFTVSDSLKRTAVSCGDDGFVRLWCVDGLKSVKAHQTHITRGLLKSVSGVTGVSWSTVNPNLIVSVANNGCFVLWHLAENLTTKFSLGTVSLTAVACSTTDENIMAIASKGSILHVRVKSSGIELTRLRIFQKDISRMAWQPGTEKLCITSEMGELSLWDMTERKCIKKEIIECNPKPGNLPKYPPQVILPVLWTDEKTLVSRIGSKVVTANYENLFAKNQKIEWHTLHSSHKRPVFALAGASNGKLLWSFASDRTFVGFNLETNKVEKSIGCLYGGSFCGAVSPHDPNLVAFGGGDGNVRVWNVTQPTGSCSIESRNISDRVMSICWHPVKDNLLLYGTKVGRIGVMDKTKTSANHPPQLLESPGAGGRPIYWLCWGPKFMAPEQTDHILYAATKKTIYTYDNLMPNTEPIDFGKLLGMNSIRDLSWKPDFSLLAVASGKGSINLYKPTDFALVHTIIGAEGMQYLSWHPQMTSTENEISPYHNLLTFGHLNPNGEIIVYKVEEIDSVVSSSVFATLKGHKDYVQSVAWSSHVSGQLTSTSDDCSVQVWNVLTETPVANFQTRDMNWFSFWSPVHPDLIISGSRDGAIFVWRISEQKNKLPSGFPGLTKKKEKKISHVCEEATLRKTQEIRPLMKNIEPKTPREHASAQMANFVHSNLSHQNILTNMWTKESVEFHNCCVLLEKDEKERSEFFRFCFFKNGPSQKLEQLGEHLQDPEQIDSLTSVMLYQGRIKELIEQKIEEGGLTDALVALAPSVSPRLWQSACSAYARQLRVGKQFTKAANYLLVGREVEKAVEVLCEGGQFIDALCLARAQLAGNDPAFDAVVRLYAKNLEAQGDFARAAECFIFLKDYEEVIRCLGRSQDPEALLCVALAAKIAGKKEIYEKTALTVCANDINCCSFKMAEKFSETILTAKLLFTAYKLFYEPVTQDSVSIFQKMAQEVDSQDTSGCYAQFLATQPRIIPKTPVPAWLITQQLCLAFCANGDNDPRRLRHVLSVLEAANLQGPEELYKCCRHFSPDLTVNGIFASDHSLGISLRAYLCLALLTKAGHDDEDELALLPQLYELQKDLLDEKAFLYHRSKAELSTIQRKFPNTFVTVAVIDESTKEMLSKRSELISKISKIEIERGVIPNPAIGFIGLRNVYLTLSYENATAKKYLEIITDKYFPLIN